MKRALFLLPLFAVPVLASCADAAAGAAPSLAKRPVEGRFDVVPTMVAVPAPGPLPADLAGRLARWGADADAAGRAFSAARDAAVPVVAAAAGTPVASEQWVQAQQAISRLQAARAPITAALADIDRLYLERSIDGAIDGLPDIYALRDRLADTVATQDAIVAALSGQLPGE